MVNANDFNGLTDIDVIEAAVKGRGSDGIVVISERKSEIEAERNYWLIDRAILLPENTTVLLENCKIKLSDKCRDNFFRSANSGIGIAFPERIKNIHIKGIGSCLLEGADHPRAVGDGSKILANPCPYEKEDIIKYAHWVPEERKKSGKLTFSDRHDYSYGTDCDKEGETPKGDWRGIGILFANVEDFSIENVSLKDYHCWGISLEECACGKVSGINFDARMHKEIDGMCHNMENQDGVDIRNGCHDILISDITGNTGDDLVALTAIARKREFKPGGSLGYTHVMHNDWTKREKDIYNITIRNIVGTSSLCVLLRFLSAEANIYNVVADGIIDTTPDDLRKGGTILIGEPDEAYGTVYPDSTRNIIINNVISNRCRAIMIRGYLSDSVISNIVNKNPDTPAIYVERKDGIKNVTVGCINDASGKGVVNEE